MTSAAVLCYKAEELLLEILNRCDIILLVGWCHVDRTFRRIGQGIIHSRTRRVLALFLPDKLLLEFFALLDKTDSFIAGSCALAVLIPHLSWTPKDLNILIPRGHVQSWCWFLESHGFQGHRIEGEHTHPRYQRRQMTSTRSLYVYKDTHQVNRSTVYLLESRLTIDSPKLS